MDCLVCEDFDQCIWISILRSECLFGLIKVYRTSPSSQAPGEAEAELAALNQRGLIDIVITDDCDAFTFGAECVLRSRFVMTF